MRRPGQEAACRPVPGRTACNLELSACRAAAAANFLDEMGTSHPDPVRPGRPA
ncbi:MAG TPA: hypothetical protein VF933_25425 [Streptosporangiaceae bacterium]